RMTEGWSQGDEATSRHFRPPATFRERFEAVVRDVAALGFRAMDVWTAHLSPRWATPEHLVAARDVLDHHGLSVPSIAGSFGAGRHGAPLGFGRMDGWPGHLSPRWAPPDHLVAARDVLDPHGLSVPSTAGSFGADRAEFDAACRVAEALGAPVLGGSTPLLFS